jgi:hypothetical protein
MEVIGPLVRTVKGSLEPDLNCDFVPARSFNHVVLEDNGIVVKSSSSAFLRGELFFYLHMPSDVAGLFPKLLSTSTFANTLSLSLSRIDGPTFSHLLTAGLLTPRMLIRMLETLHGIHLSPGCDCLSCNADDRVNMYDNLARKLRSRLQKNKNVYDVLSTIMSRDRINVMLALLDDYEREGRGLAVNVLHGDPVLVNIIAERRGGEARFIDMRGLQGDTELTLAGDATYDLAKVLQSIAGYDHIVRGCKLVDQDAAMLVALQEAFQTFIQRLYPGINYIDVVLVASSLYASLIPLHESQTHRELFAERAMALLDIVTTTRMAAVVTSQTEDLPLLPVIKPPLLSEMENAVEA